MPINSVPKYYYVYDFSANILLAAHFRKQVLVHLNSLMHIKSKILCNFVNFIVTEHEILVHNYTM